MDLTSRQADSDSLKEQKIRNKTFQKGTQKRKEKENYTCVIEDNLKLKHFAWEDGNWR